MQNNMKKISSFLQFDMNFTEAGNTDTKEYQKNRLLIV